MTSIINMEHYKRSDVLNDSSISKLMTKKWIKLNYLSSVHYSFNNSIRFKTLMLKSDFCHYSDA